MTKPHLKNILSPQSIAVIGASHKKESVGHAVFSNLIKSNFKGALYPVNPKKDEILGKKPFASVLDIPGPIDLAVIVTPREAVAKVLEECGKKEICAAVIITAGFKEIGGEGIELEKKVEKVARQHGISLIGPNCLGVINTATDISMNASFASGEIKAGKVAFISQSGAIGVAALDYAQKKDFGFSKFVSIGNKADLNECDILEYLKDDPDTKVILMYLEDLEDPKRFLDLAKTITTEYGKPILTIKSGRTQEGQKAASSHTGALSGSDQMYESLFIQSGALRLDTLEEMFDHAIAFSLQPLPAGNRVAIVTNAGGPGILTTDACVRYGLTLAPFSEATKTNLKAHLPITANIHNPVDVIGDADADRYAAAIEAAMTDENVDALIVICTPQLMTNLEQVANVVAEKTKGSKKPIFCSFMSLVATDQFSKIFKKAGIPNYPFPESCARSIAAMSKYSKWMNRPKTEFKVYSDIDKTAAQKVITQARAEHRAFLTENEAYAILQAYGFPIPAHELARTDAEAITAAQKIGYPIVLKIVSPNIMHKTEVGGVVLNLKNESELKTAFNQLLETVKKKKPDARITGVNVLPYVSDGIEVILGMNRDAHFGPLLMFGMGGIYTEVYKDVTFRRAPIHELGAEFMIEAIKGYPILKGARGKKECDIGTIADCLKRLSQLVSDFPEIQELDMNPVKVFEKGRGVIIVDARIVIQ